MRNYYTLVFLFVAFLAEAGKEIKYPVFLIDESLKKDAHAVYRLQKHRVNIESIERITHEITYAVTIYNKKGYNHAYFYEPYDQFSKVKNVSGAIYDSFGNRVEKIKGKDFIDASMLNNSYHYSDGRVMKYNPNYYQYPFTVEYTYTIEESSSYYIAGFYTHGYNTSYEHVSYEVSVPNSLQLKYRSLNGFPEANEKNADGKKVFSWEMNDFAAMKDEPYNPPYYELTPRLLLTLNKFQLDGQEGSYNNWQEYGAFFNRLNQGRDVLSDELKAKVHQLTDHLEDPSDKARALYRYMQENNRYVYIGLGIGGLQPFPATTVANTGYGDCKALTNYMMAMLKEAGVLSHYTLVGSGKGKLPMYENFVSDYFDHVFLCMPNKGDTIWMECTSQESPFGYLGNFTDDRKVLVINEEGGKLVKSKTYSREENQEIRKADVHIFEDGSANIHLKETMKGLKYDYVKLQRMEEKDRLDYLSGYYDLPSYHVDVYELEDHPEIIPYSVKELKISLQSLGSKTGNYMLMPLYSFFDYGVPASVNKRTTNVYIRDNMMETDSIIYHLPSDLKLNELPENKSVVNRFGQYKIDIQVEGNKINVRRYLEINKGTYPASTYEELREFFKSVKNNDEQKLVLISEPPRSN